MTLNKQELEMLSEGLSMYIGYYAMEMTDEQEKKADNLKKRIDDNLNNVQFGRVLIEGSATVEARA